MVLRWDEGWVGRVNAYDPVPIRGDHGFDPAHRNMRSAFYAYGPAFKQNELIKGTALLTVDMYELMCRVLRIQPKANNGTYSHIGRMIVDDYPKPENNAAVSSFQLTQQKYQNNILSMASIFLFNIYYYNTAAM